VTFFGHDFSPKKIVSGTKWGAKIILGQRQLPNYYCDSGLGEKRHEK
jgi:hypothetical protein